MISKIIYAITFLFVSYEAQAHARLDPLKSPKPRNDSSGLKSGPCGNVAATNNPEERTTLVAGSELQLNFQETIDHPGYYRIAFSPENDQGFDQNVLIEMANDIQGAPNPSFADPRQYTVSVTVPDTVCDKCTLQLIQVMTDRNPASNYYSCADIRIVSEQVTVPEKPSGLQIQLIKD